MKVVNLEEFLKLPEYTLFSKYQPNCFDPLCMKGESLLNSGDFWYTYLSDALDCDDTGDYFSMHDRLIEGKSSDIDLEVVSRDGCFEKGQLFAVYEKKDIEQFVDVFNKCLNAFNK
jgi:hypothetical protein